MVSSPQTASVLSPITFAFSNLTLGDLPATDHGVALVSKLLAIKGTALSKK